MTFSSVHIEHGVHGHKGDYVTRGRHVLVLDDADDAHVWHDVSEYDGLYDGRIHGDRIHGDRHDEHGVEQVLAHDDELALSLNAHWLVLMVGTQRAPHDDNHHHGSHIQGDCIHGDQQRVRIHVRVHFAGFWKVKVMSTVK